MMRAACTVAEQGLFVKRLTPLGQLVLVCVLGYGSARLKRRRILNNPSGGARQRSESRAQRSCKRSLRCGSGLLEWAAGRPPLKSGARSTSTRVNRCQKSFLPDFTGRRPETVPHLSSGPLDRLLAFNRAKNDESRTRLNCRDSTSLSPQNRLLFASAENAMQSDLQRLKHAQRS